MLHLVPLGHGLVQPLIPQVLGDDDRRPIMDVPERVMRGPGEDRRGHQPLVVGVLGLGGVGPELVQAGEAQQLVLVLTVEVVRGLRPVLVLLPLVVPVRRHQGPSLGGRSAERRLLRDRLTAGVDHPGTGSLRVLGPDRHESPACDLEAAHQLPLAQLLGDERDPLHRGDVPRGFQLVLECLVDAERVPDSGLVVGERGSS